MASPQPDPGLVPNRYQLASADYGLDYHMWLMFDDVCSFHVSRGEKDPLEKRHCLGIVQCCSLHSIPGRAKGCFTPWLLVRVAKVQSPQWGPFAFLVSVWNTARPPGVFTTRLGGRGRAPKDHRKALVCLDGFTMFYPVHLVVKVRGGIGCSTNMRPPPNQRGTQHPRTNCHLHLGCSSSIVDL